MNENDRGGTQEPLKEDEKIHLQFLSSDKSISSNDSLEIMDHLSLHIYDRESLNAAFENIDSFIDRRSCTQKHLNGNQGIQKYSRDCISQFPVGKALNKIH